MNAIASKLNIKYLNKFELANTKNWFEVKNGTITVKPFNAQGRDIAMQIGGSHSLTNEMAYSMTKTPRKALKERD